MTTQTGIKFSLAWLVIAAIVPIIAFSVWMAWTFIVEQRGAIEAELNSTARALMVAVDRELDSQLKAMDMLSTAHSLDNADLDKFTYRARRAVAGRPEWLDVVLVDPRSHAIVAGALPIPVPAPTSSASKAVDKVVATGKPLIVGAFATGKIVRRPMILLMTPVAWNGDVRFVMTVVLDPAAFNSIFNQQRLPPSWTGAVIDSDLTIAGRSRTPELFVGKPATPSLAERIAASDNGMFVALNQEGSKTYTVFNRSSVTGWSVGLGIPAAELDGPRWRTVLVISAAGAALIAVAVVLAVVVGRGIVARRLAYEGAIRKSEERMRLFFERQLVGMAITSLEKGWTQVNDRLCQMLGYTRDELFSLTWAEITHPDDLAADVAQFDRLLAGEIDEYSLDKRFFGKDGRIIFTELSVGCVRREDGSVDYILALLADITERKLNQQRIEHLLVEQKAMLENELVGIVKVKDRKISWANPAFEKMLGYEPGEIFGTPTRNNYPSVEAYEAFGAAAYPVVMRGEIYRTQFEHVRKDGQHIWVDISGAVLDPDSGTSLWGFVDITERVSLERNLEQTNAELEQFAYVASHDMRQPLRMVTSYLSQIEKALAPESLTEDIKKYLGFAVGGAKRMDSLIVGLLEYSRTGRSGEKVAVPLGDAVADALTNLTVAIREAEAEIIVADDLPTINGDAIELTRLFQNLIGNAVKYRAPERKPRVEVGCRHQGHEWLILISDNGIGIAQEDCERAFAIFQRLVAQDAYEGTGIGLAVCKKIVEHHGGRIWIASEVGVGSTFFVALPTTKR